MNPVRKLAGLLLAVVVLGRVACPPLAFGADASTPISQAEAENFVSSFYRDLEGDDVETVVARFDRTVEFYKSGPKDRAFITNVFERLFASYPSRSYSVAAVKLKPAAKADRATVSFDLRSFVRNPAQDVSVPAHAHVEWDLVKTVGGVLKIVRFDGTDVTAPAASPSR
jgi:hypothetical protein